MTSIPTSPVTPSRQRRNRFSDHDFSLTSISPYRSNGTTFSRRSSHTSQSSPLQQHLRSPQTPRRIFTHSRKSSAGMSASSIPGDFITTGGIDSLADELGDVWDDEGHDEQGSSFLEGLREGSLESQSGEEVLGNSFGVEDMHDFGFGMVVLSPIDSQADVGRRETSMFQPSGLRTMANGNARSKMDHHTVSRHKGTFCVHDSEGEDGNILSRGLENRMSDIESLTHSNISSDGLSEEEENVFVRTTASLKDLGAQSSLENGASRLITAYTSTSIHRTHKTKELFSQSHALLFTPYPTLSEETIDQVLPDVEDLLLCCIPISPLTQPNPLASLHALISNTSDLIFSLQSLSDILEESRVVTSTASRRLKGVKDLVKEIRLEEDAREEGVRWIDKGNWDQRLREREAGSICQDVVGGFEKTCDMWRERLLGGGGAATAVVGDVAGASI